MSISAGEKFDGVKMDDITPSLSPIWSQLMPQMPVLCPPNRVLSIEEIEGFPLVPNSLPYLIFIISGESASTFVCRFGIPYHVELIVG